MYIHIYIHMYMYICTYMFYTYLCVCMYADICIHLWTIFCGRFVGFENFRSRDQKSRCLQDSVAL